jgi:hypothetical protein
MRSFIVAAALATALGALVPSSASAQGVRIGPGGVEIETRRERVVPPRGRGEIERRDFDRPRGRDRVERRPQRCRIEVERTRNRRGEVVTRRVEVCR